MSDGDVAESPRLLVQIAGLADADYTARCGYAASWFQAGQRDERLTARERYAAGDSGDRPRAGSPQH